jgi:trimethylamine:corrinoid methyltransferase-like protein
MHSGLLPKLMDRRTVTAWLDAPDNAFARAEEKVREILKTHDPHPLRAEQERDMQKVVDRATRDLMR